MKILSVSDVEEPTLYDRPLSEAFKGVELILSCGDLPPEYLAFLSNRFEVPLFYVRGNHDLRYENKSLDGCVDLHARIARHRGIRLLGLEGSRWYNGGPYQYRDAQMAGFIRRLRLQLWMKGGVDIVISHAPPRHVHDAEDRCHRGFSAFHRLIERYSPRYFIHGHIHTDFADPTQRTTMVSHTRVVNSFGYFLFDYDNGTTHR